MSEQEKLSAAVDAFAELMKARLYERAIVNGWRGWDEMGSAELGDRLVGNAARGAAGDLESLVDAANLAMMIHRSINEQQGEG